MSSDNRRPPLKRTGQHYKCPSMVERKRNKLLDFGELDFSVIECSDDKEYTSSNDLLNSTDDNIMKSYNMMKTFEKSQT
jgi:hypothetical protein